MSPRLPSPAVVANNNNNSSSHIHHNHNTAALFGPSAAGGAGNIHPGVTSGTGAASSGAMGGNPNLMQTPSPATISALVSQHRLLELSRFSMRGYDLAQHMLTQQGAVSKLLGECKFPRLLLLYPL